MFKPASVEIAVRLIFFGLITSIVCFGLTLLVFVGFRGASGIVAITLLLLAFLGMFAGLIISSIAMAAFWRLSKGSKEMRRVPNCRIVSKLSANRKGEMQFPETAADCHEDYELFIQLVDEAGHKDEFGCNPELWDLIWERDTGTATVQGRYLVAFESTERRSGDYEHPTVVTPSEEPPEPWRAG